MSEIDDLIRAIYGIVASDEAVGSMLVALARHFDCGSAALFYVHPRRPETTISIAYGPLADPDVQARYRRTFAALDPAPSAFGRLPLGAVATTDEIFRDTLPLYRRFLDGFYHPIGLRAALGGPIADEGGQIGLVAVHRGPERAPFGQDDIAVMERLTPHIAQAVALRQRFFALESRADALGQAFEPLSLGLLLFEDGQLTEANAAARAILARADGLALDRSGALTATDPMASERLRAIVRSAGPGVVAVPRTGGGAYALRFYCFEREPKLGATRCAVLVCDTDAAPADAALLLKAIYGMTEPAAQLVVALLRGGSLESHAAEAGISRNTAKFHLKTAFAATASRRQTDLVRRVASVVNALSGQ